MVHYMPHGISWKCKFTESHINDSDEWYDMGKYSGWCELIEYYSECQLTKEGDRLVALQGIANEMQKASEDRYYLGLWCGELPGQLLWMGGNLKKNEELHGIPSWTWASMIGKVSFPCRAMWGRFEDVCDEIIFGHSRELRIRGRTKHGTCDEDLAEDSDYSLEETLDQAERFLSFFDATPGQLYRIKDLDGQHKESVGLAAFDSIDQIPTKFCCLSLMKGRGRGDIVDGNDLYRYFVLLLESSSPDENYIRGSGLASLHQSHGSTERFLTMSVSYND